MANGMAKRKASVNRAFKNLVTPLGALLMIQSWSWDSKKPIPPNTIPLNIPIIRLTKSKMRKRGRSFVNKYCWMIGRITAIANPSPNWDKFCTLRVKSLKEVTTNTPKGPGIRRRSPRRNRFSGPTVVIFSVRAPIPKLNMRSAVTNPTPTMPTKNATSSTKSNSALKPSMVSKVFITAVGRFIPLK